MGTLYIAKWPGELSMFRGMSPAGPPPSARFTDATSNRGATAAGWPDAAHQVNRIRQAWIGFIDANRTNRACLFSARPKNAALRSFCRQGPLVDLRESM